jgi:TRAP-type mannitol/chloroaromatic compound transport system permease small subunit
VSTQEVESGEPVPVSKKTTTLVRLFGWMMLGIMLVYIINNFLTFGGGMPGANAVFEGTGGALAWLQVAFYPLLLVVIFLMVTRSTDRSLREDSNRITDINTVFIRCAFWVVLIVGVGDAIVSFLRIENFLPMFVGEDLTRELGKPEFRGIYFHMPLMLAGIILGFFTRTLGFTWLALLIVLAELLIVFSRFIFSYEQALMADLVRFWYGALFLFASAFTLLEEGHVRVDVFYAGFTQKTKGFVNAVGSIFLGLTLCWTILIVGMSGQFSIINAPIFNFEVTQSSFGMYVKYMMAGFLAVFAISMMIQFVAYLMDAIADYRGEPGKRIPDAPGAH